MEKKVVIAKIQVLPGKENEFKSLVSPLVEASKAEPGNLVYSLYQNTQEPDRFIAYEEYESQEAFQLHGQTPHFQSFVQNVTPLLAAEIDIQSF